MRAVATTCLSIVLLACDPAKAQVSTVYMFAKTDNPKTGGNQVCQQVEDLSNPYFRGIRREFGLEEIVAEGTTDFHKILLLRHWVHTTLQKGDALTRGLTGNPVEVLRKAQAGTTGWHRDRYVKVLHVVLNSMGYTSRPVYHGPGYDDDPVGEGHYAVNEVWSADWAKWVLMDAQSDCHYKSELAAVPLSSIEIRYSALFREKGKHLYRLIGPKQKKTTEFTDDSSPFLYRWVAHPMGANWYTPKGGGLHRASLLMLDDDYSRANKWGWTLADGGREEHWGYARRFFLTTSRWGWIDWAVDTVNIDQRIDGQTLDLHLASNSPNFREHQIREVGKGTWGKAEGRMRLPLHAERHEWEVRAINTMGICGPVSLVVVEQANPE